MKKIVSKILFFLMFASILDGCKKPDPEGVPAIPTINTIDVSSVTDNSAVCGGSIVSDGYKEITKRGVCFSTHHDNTLSDNVVEYSGTADDFTVTLTGLTPNTTYYVRSFATNEVGTGYGTTEEIFKTSTSLPTVTTLTVTSILSSSAYFKGQVTSNGGGIISSSGFCYGTSPNPTLANGVGVSSMVTDTFSVHQFNLDTTTTYYVRAYATNNAGTSYGNQLTFTTSSPVFKIGQTYQGGIIFYIDDSEMHGYVATSSDQSSSSLWGCKGTTISGATSTFLGDGNTAAIVLGCGDVTFAALLCANLNLNGYTDWFLPSKEELNLIYQNLYLQSLGGFSTYSYWSSTQVNGNNAWSHNFSTNTQSSANKNSPYSVRAIRAF